VKVAILWHMHQPSYWDAQLGRYRYPWAFLHAVRHYHAMALLSKLHPRVRLTFNITPVLLEQLAHYARDPLADVLLEVLLKPADGLDEEETRRLLDHVFKLNHATMIDPFPRFRELRGHFGGGLDKAKLKRLKVQEILDLQTLYLLSWCGSPLRDQEMVKGLIRRERDYRENDKKNLFAAQRELVAGTVPLYREIQELGHAEISTTPYYHPILPLLIDCEVAREARSNAPLEGVDFHVPGDADWQVGAAVRAYRSSFGSDPAGMWPAEGAVSMAALELMAQHGIRWSATDEGILGRTFQRGLGLAEKHRPYRVGDRLFLFFRDRELSDRIGFIYSSWDPVKAADDLIGRLLGIRDHLQGAEARACVTIILDGENPWEYYPDRGVGFLGRLYQQLAATSGLETVRFKDHLESADAGSLSHVSPGSWIDANFDTWIGSPEKNHAWKILSAARRKLAVEAPQAEVPVEFYRAEGSDWFWWLGPGHDTPYESSYENLFRLNLKQGLEKAGLEVPSIFHAASPVLPSPIFQPPMHLFAPKIDGRIGSYYDWIAAGFYRASEGSLHRTSRRLSRIRFGFDARHLYLRLEGDLESFRRESGRSVVLEFQRPRAVRAVLSGGGLNLSGEGGTGIRSAGRAAFGEVVELSIPLEELGAKTGDSVEFAAAILVGRDAIDRLPQFGFVTLPVPSTDFGRENWSV
jgi:alpha-amylase/alpha-mannosidase (GH57 family)